jgi:hypothetical protein
MGTNQCAQGFYTPQRNCPDANTTPSAAMPATRTTTETPPTGLTEETERLVSDKSIASFQNVYKRPIDEDTIKEADALAKAQADNPVDLIGTQF